jgi:hypothetical protein
MRVQRRFRPVAEALGVIALCSGIGYMIVTGPLPEEGGAPPGGFLEGPGGGVEPVDTSSGVDLGLSGIDPPTGDVTPQAVNPVGDYDALIGVIRQSDPTPVAPAGAFD